MRPLLIRHLASHLDQGLSPWHNPARPLGFYAAWRQNVARDIGWAMDSLPGARLEVSQLPNDAIDTVLVELTWLGLPEERWPAYLERLALELPGWSGMFLWRHNHPGYADTKDVPVAMMDYLAVRLVLERLVAADCVRRHWNIDFSLAAIREYFRCHPAELWVRHAFHGGDLPEYLLDLIEPHLPATGDAGLPQTPVRPCERRIVDRPGCENVITAGEPIREVADGERISDRLIVAQHRVEILRHEEPDPPRLPAAAREAAETEPAGARNPRRRSRYSASGSPRPETRSI